MFLTSGQKYGSVKNYLEEDKCYNGDCSAADNVVNPPPPTSISKKKLGLSFICFGILFIAYNKFEQFAGVRTESDVLATKQNKYPNIAPMGTATASNSKQSSKAELAIDGNDNTGFKWKKGFWKVSFSDISYMRNIKLSFGGYGKNLCDDMVLDVLDASDEVVFTTGANIKCTGNAQNQANVYVGKMGHSVRVTNKKGRQMNLKDARVFGYVKINLALGGLASQSSIWDVYYGPASRAIDGNTDGTFSGNGDGQSVTHTLWERTPWWKVDLRGSFPIHTVKLYNRSNAQDRLQQFQVQLLDSKGNIVDSKDYDTGVITTSLTMTFDDIEASQVKVLMKDTGVNRLLSLAEVEIFSVEA